MYISYATFRFAIPYFLINRQQNLSKKETKKSHLKFLTIKSKQIWPIMTAKKDSAQPNRFRAFLHHLSPILLYLSSEAKKRKN